MDLAIARGKSRYQRVVPVVGGCMDGLMRRVRAINRRMGISNAGVGSQQAAAKLC